VSIPNAAMQLAAIAAALAGIGLIHPKTRSLAIRALLVAVVLASAAGVAQTLFK